REILVVRVRRSSGRPLRTPFGGVGIGARAEALPIVSHHRPIVGRAAERKRESGQPEVAKGKRESAQQEVMTALGQDPVQVGRLTAQSSSNWIGRSFSKN